MAETRWFRKLSERVKYVTDSQAFQRWTSGRRGHVVAFTVGLLAAVCHAYLLRRIDPYLYLDYEGSGGLEYLDVLML